MPLAIDWKKLLHGRGGEGGDGATMGSLPTTDREFVQRCQAEYESAASHGGQEAVDACFRLAWALVHSAAGGADVQRGVELAEALGDGTGVEQRDVQYM